MTFGPQSTTWDVVRGLDLSGSTAVVTGGSGGLGFATARALVAAGAAVVLLDKDAEGGERSASRLREQHPAADVESRAVDLTDHDGIRALATALPTDRPRIDVLVNNAGAVFGGRRLTSFGWEATLATNFLGHFLLTALLAPTLRGGRIVNVGSGAHRRSPIVWDDPHFARRPYQPRAAYAQSKTAVALGTLGLRDRLRGGTHVYTVRPGVVATGLYGDLSDEQQAAFSSRVAGGGTGMSVEQAAATTVWAATSPDLAAADGGYLAACAVVGTPDSPSTVDAHTPWIFDHRAADRLWRLAEDAVGKRFALSAERKQVS